MEIASPPPTRVLRPDDPGIWGNGRHAFRFGAFQARRVPSRHTAPAVRLTGVPRLRREPTLEATAKRSGDASPSLESPQNVAAFARKPAPNRSPAPGWTSWV